MFLFLLIHKLSLFTVRTLKNRNVDVVFSDVSCYEKFLSAVQSNVRFSCRTLRTCVDLKTTKNKWTQEEWVGRESGRKNERKTNKRYSKCVVSAWFPYNHCHFKYARKVHQLLTQNIFSNTSHTRTQSLDFCLLMTMKSVEILIVFSPKTFKIAVLKFIMMIAAAETARKIRFLFMFTLVSIW